MVSLKRSQSKSRPPTRHSDSVPGLAPAAGAVSFTLILTQVQSAYQADHHNLAIVLVSALLFLISRNRT
jgi:hypothetical protein